jgi:4-amino-4-deoxy-L-arabinose transferase-like glycosyltransferase
MDGLVNVAPARRDVVAIAAIAFLVRAAWALVYGRVEAGPHDALFYQVAAAGLADGRGYSHLFGDPTAHWPPGFPFIVSIAYVVIGVHVKLALALNVALGTATAALMYAIARRMMGRAAGLVAGVAFAFLPTAVYFTGLFLAETTYLFMLVAFLGLVLVLGDRRWAPVALGVAAGLAALTKGEGVLLLVIPLATWWGLPRRAWLSRAGVLVAAMALTILPWTIRNAIEMDAFIPVATNASTTLWSGHNSEANGGPTYAPESLLARIPEGLDPTQHEVEEAALLRREALHWAVRNPHKELGLIPRKLIQLGNASSQVFPIWFNAEGDYQVGTSSRLVFGVLGDAFDYLLIFVALGALLVLGVRRLAQMHPLMRGVLAYLAASLFTYGFVYYGQFRYRLPMEPLLILVATPLVVAAWQSRGTLRSAAGSAPWKAGS